MGDQSEHYCGTCGSRLEGPAPPPPKRHTVVADAVRRVLIGIERDSWARERQGFMLVQAVLDRLATELER